MPTTESSEQAASPMGRQLEWCFPYKPRRLLKMRKVRHGGGLRAIRYSFRKARQAGGLWQFYKALRSKNACKTCALGMGGQKGGMVNEAGAFPEVCKKSMQAMASDMQPAITADFWQRNYRLGVLGNWNLLAVSFSQCSGSVAKAIIALLLGWRRYRGWRTV